MLPGNAPLKRPGGFLVTSSGGVNGCVAPFKLIEPTIAFLAVSPIQMLPFSPPDAKNREPSAENTTPMNVAFTGMRVTVGVDVQLRMSVTENRDAPLLIVAITRPSGDSASPYGF